MVALAVLRQAGWFLAAVALFAALSWLLGGHASRLGPPVAAPLGMAAAVAAAVLARRVASEASALWAMAAGMATYVVLA
jgi:hypothetical protein